MGDRLTYNIYKNSGLVDLSIPPMIIQPLVENAVKHGINPTNKAGTIDVRVDQEEGMVKISISDTGRGINPDEALSSNGIGIRNTNQVLINKYGNDSKLRIRENREGGASVYFYIPMNHTSTP